MRVVRPFCRLQIHVKTVDAMISRVFLAAEVMWIDFRFFVVVNSPRTGLVQPSVYRRLDLLTLSIPTRFRRFNVAKVIIRGPLELS